jgi:hypothetical protein
LNRWSNWPAGLDIDANTVILRQVSWPGLKGHFVVETKFGGVRRIMDPAGPFAAHTPDTWANYIANSLPGTTETGVDLYITG